MKLPPKKTVIAQQVIFDLIEQHLYALSIIDDDVEIQSIDIDWGRGFDYMHDPKGPVPIIIHFKQPTRVTKVKGGTSISFND